MTPAETQSSARDVLGRRLTLLKNLCSKHLPKLYRQHGLGLLDDSGSRRTYAGREARHLIQAATSLYGARPEFAAAVQFACLWWPWRHLAFQKLDARLAKLIAEDQIPHQGDLAPSFGPGKELTQKGVEQLRRTLKNLGCGVVKLPPLLRGTTVEVNLQAGEPVDFRAEELHALLRGWYRARSTEPDQTWVRWPYSTQLNDAVMDIATSRPSALRPFTAVLCLQHKRSDVGEPEAYWNWSEHQSLFKITSNPKKARQEAVADLQALDFFAPMHRHTGQALINLRSDLRRGKRGKYGVFVSLSSDLIASSHTNKWTLPFNTEWLPVARDHDRNRLLRLMILLPFAWKANLDGIVTGDEAKSTFTGTRLWKLAGIESGLNKKDRRPALSRKEQAWDTLERLLERLIAAGFLQDYHWYYGKPHDDPSARRVVLRPSLDWLWRACFPNVPAYQPSYPGSPVHGGELKEYRDKLGFSSYAALARALLSVDNASYPTLNRRHATLQRDLSRLEKDHRLLSAAYRCRLHQLV